MKRYSTRGPVVEEDGGVFVLASEYDDTSKLLEEAVMLLSDAKRRFEKHEMSVDSEAPPEHRCAMLAYGNFLARANEVLK